MEGMDGQRKKPSSEQSLALFHELLHNKELARGRPSGPRVHDRSQEMWRQLAGRLNAMGGCNKTLEQWKKYWQDKKSKLKGPHLQEKLPGLPPSGPVSPWDRELILFAAIMGEDYSKDLQDCVMKLFPRCGQCKSECRDKSVKPCVEPAELGLGVVGCRSRVGAREFEEAEEEEAAELAEETVMKSADPIFIELPGSNRDAASVENKTIPPKWRTLAPKLVKPTIIPLLRTSVADKHVVTNAYSRLGDARMELVQLQLQMTRNEMRYKEEEHNLRIEHMHNEERRKEEEHERKMSNYEKNVE